MFLVSTFMYGLHQQKVIFLFVEVANDVDVLNAGKI